MDPSSLAFHNDGTADQVTTWNRVEVVVPHRGQSGQRLVMKSELNTIHGRLGLVGLSISTRERCSPRFEDFFAVE